MSLEYNFLSYPSKSPLDLLQTIKEDFSLNSLKSLITGTPKKNFQLFLVQILLFHAALLKEG